MYSVQNVAIRRGPGRPKGSKNKKPAASSSNSASGSTCDDSSKDGSTDNIQQNRRQRQRKDGSLSLSSNSSNNNEVQDQNAMDQDNDNEEPAQGTSTSNSNANKKDNIKIKTETKTGTTCSEIFNYMSSQRLFSRLPYDVKHLSKDQALSRALDLEIFCNKFRADLSQVEQMKDSMNMYKSKGYLSTAQELQDQRLELNNNIGYHIINITTNLCILGKYLEDWDNRKCGISGVVRPEINKAIYFMKDMRDLIIKLKYLEDNPEARFEDREVYLLYNNARRRVLASTEESDNVCYLCPIRWKCDPFQKRKIGKYKWTPNAGREAFLQHFNEVHKINSSN